ncbi:hypothetical protein ACWF0M_12835 [Kribbella sp. NPDC055110]
MHRESRESRHDPEPGDDQLPADAAPPRWSIRRALELLDEAIDKMGDQLARSAGLYADSPPELPSVRREGQDVRRRVRRRPVDDHGPPTVEERYEPAGGPEQP